MWRTEYHVITIVFYSETPLYFLVFYASFYGACFVTFFFPSSFALNTFLLTYMKQEEIDPDNTVSY